MLGILSRSVGWFSSLLVVFLLAGCTPILEDRMDSLTAQRPVGQSKEVAENTPAPTKAFEPFEATFLITTLGTDRVFTASMYHHQSEQVFIDALHPDTIQVRESGVTWRAFFETLPFSLDETCLVTGTKQKFCNDNTHSLHFTLNGIATPGVLDLVIQPDDSLEVWYE